MIAPAGANFYFFRRLYDDYLRRNPKPRVLVVGIDLTALDKKRPAPNPEYFYPFIRSDDAVAGCEEYDYIRGVKAAGYFYFKEIYYDMIMDPDRSGINAGYFPVDKSWDNTSEPFIGKLPNGFDLAVDGQIVDDIMHFIGEENRHGVICLGMIAPEFSGVWKYQNNRAFALGRIMEAASREGVHVLNFSDSSYAVCFDQSLFFNSEHLNKKGAERFSRDLADSLANCVK
jgi:hypothetical protein